MRLLRWLAWWYVIGLPLLVWLVLLIVGWIEDYRGQMPRNASPEEMAAWIKKRPPR